MIPVFPDEIRAELRFENRHWSPVAMARAHKGACHHDVKGPTNRR